MSTELKPCPFCGQNPYINIDEPDSPNAYKREYRVECKNDDCNGWQNKKQDAINAWNRRYDED